MSETWRFAETGYFVSQAAIEKRVGVENPKDRIFERDVLRSKKFSNLAEREDNLVVPEPPGVPVGFNWHVDDCQEKVCASVSSKLLSQKLVGKLSAGAIRITSQIKIINSTDKLKYF